MKPFLAAIAVVSVIVGLTVKPSYGDPGGMKQLEVGPVNMKLAENKGPGFDETVGWIDRKLRQQPVIELSCKSNFRDGRCHKKRYDGFSAEYKITGTYTSQKCYVTWKRIRSYFNYDKKYKEYFRKYTIGLAASEKFTWSGWYDFYAINVSGDIYLEKPGKTPSEDVFERRSSARIYVKKQDIAMRVTKAFNHLHKLCKKKELF